MLQRVKRGLGRLHADTSGAMSIEKILIIALIALPIIIALVVFREKIAEWFKKKDDDLSSHAD